MDRTIIVSFVTVSFGSLTYSFSEGAGQSSAINIFLSTSIAQALSVIITGDIYNVLYSNHNIYFITYSGPGTQPSTVNISGSDVNSTVIFQAGDVSVPLPNFNITDDTTALETNEIYQLSIISSTPSQDVTLGVPTEITITDDDGELIRFLIFQFSFVSNSLMPTHHNNAVYKPYAINLTSNYL